MEIILAKSAGFCFGVSNAVNLVYKLIKNKKDPIYTLGPIIHNEQVVENLESNGVVTIYTKENIRDLPSMASIVIRAHGVTPEFYEEIISRKLKLEDATCPYVKKIHNLVRDKYNEGYHIVIVGDKEHPEVIGINGWCNNTASIVNGVDEVDSLKEVDKNVCVVAQTTITYEKWENINSRLKMKYSNILKYNTICSATSKRQEEAARISENVDVMLVIGSVSSSNTQKLYEICKANCINTYRVEKPEDVDILEFKNIKKIGVTAGASTPDWVIKEVMEKMINQKGNNENMELMMEYENSLKAIRSGEVMKGKVIAVRGSEVYVDLGYKSDGIIPKGEFSGEADVNLGKHVKVGDEIEVYVVNVNDGEGNVTLSKKKVGQIRATDRIKNAFYSKENVNVKITGATKGGLTAISDGVRVFIPASQVSNKFIKNFDEYIDKTIDVKIIEFDERKRRIIGSARTVLEEQEKISIDKILTEIEVGQKLTGTVKNLMDFGAFVDLGGVDGLVHISEISWGKIKHPSEVINIGDIIEVYVKDFDKGNKKISLGYKKTSDNPWNTAFSKYEVGSVFEGKVVRFTKFGVFIELEKGIDGMVHISQISNVRIENPNKVLKLGQVVKVKVIKHDEENKRISLSIKEVSPIDPSELDEL